MTARQPCVPGLVRIVRLDEGQQLSDVPRALGIPIGLPVLVLVGGASAMSGVDELARTTLERVVLPVVREAGAIIVDGGTDSGIMRLVGDAAERAGWHGPLVGVTVEAMVGPPATPRVGLEPRHTHVLLVPGSRWGDESETLADLATVLAAGAPTATLVVNGGEIARTDVTHSHRSRRPVLVLGGSGRLADELAASDEGVTVLDPTRPVDEQRATLSRVLSRPTR